MFCQHLEDGIRKTTMIFLIRSVSFKEYKQSQKKTYTVSFHKMFVLLIFTRSILLVK